MSVMEESLEPLKEPFTIVPNLPHVNTRICIVQTYVSNFPLGAILSQKDENGWLYLLAIYSQKIQPAKINYQVQDKELLAVVDSFKVWHRYLESPPKMIIVYTDYEHLQDLMTTQVLNRRQARWT
jgi:hypothetical protein